MVGGLFYLRRTADGFKNVFSLNYWIERRAGFDLYNPTQHFFKRGRRDRHELLLTFDDAPHLKSTPSLLRTLRDAHVRAAFFVIGKRVNERPELIRQMISEGHEVGNHTQDHLRLDQLTLKQIRSQIIGCELSVAKATNYQMRFLRPPGMRLNPAVSREVSALGYTVVGWNVGAKDFIPDQQITDMSKAESKALKTTSQQIADRTVAQAKDGAIILLHDNPMTAQALPQIISRLRSEGYEFVTTSQMLAELPHPVIVVANPKSANKLAMVHPN